MKKQHYVDFKVQFYISLTEHCNWKCKYCDFPKIKNCKTTPIDDVLRYFDMLKTAAPNNSGVEYGLEGGELGMLSEEYLDQVFAHDLAESYIICTNGLFMERGYHTRYADKIHYILYHVQPELNDDFYIPQYTYNDIDVKYAIVVDKTNIYDGSLEKIVNDYIDIDTYFIPHILQPRTPGLDLLELDDFKKLYSIIEGKRNIEPWFIVRVARIIEQLDKTSWINARRTTCANTYNHPIFDLPNGNINRCCISITGGAVPLTPDNLQKFWNNEKLFATVNDHTCEGCIAGFVWADDRIDNVGMAAYNVIHEFAIEENNRRS